MITRAVDANGEWVFGNGKGSYRSGRDAVIQNINTALNMFKGEAFWDVQFGVDWFNLIGGKAPQVQQNIILQCKQVVSDVDGVLSINSLNVAFAPYRRGLTITMNVSTVYGNVLHTVNKGFANG